MQADLKKLLKVKQLRFDKAERLLREAEEAYAEAQAEVERIEQELTDMREQAEKGRETLHDQHLWRFNTRTEFEEFQHQLAQWTRKVDELEQSLREAEQALLEAEANRDQCEADKLMAARQVEKFDYLVDEDKKRAASAQVAKEDAEAEEISELRYR